MNSLKIKECPCCLGLNIIRVNGKAHENNFQRLKGFILKKIFNCRKCKAELGLFEDNDNNNQLFWMELLKCEDVYYKNLNNLQNSKLKCKGNNKKYNAILKEITTVQNQLRQEKIKLKVKHKMQNLGMFI